MNVVAAYHGHHLTIEVILKDRQDVSMCGECAALTVIHRTGGKLRKCQKVKNKKTQKFENQQYWMSVSPTLTQGKTESCSSRIWGTMWLMSFRF